MVSHYQEKVQVESTLWVIRVLYPEPERLLYFLPILIWTHAMKMYYEKNRLERVFRVFFKGFQTKRGIFLVKCWRRSPSPAVTASYLYLLSQSLQLPFQVCFLFLQLHHIA